MFKELWFDKTTNFSLKPVKVLLDQHINVIIGPKGGGKSTLFDLLVGLKENCIYDSVENALKEYGLKFNKAIKFNNEVINISQLSKRKKKDKEEDYKRRNDVIYQDDPIKKDLTNFSEIDKEKTKYLSSQLENSKSVADLITKIKNLYNSMNKIHQMSSNGNVDINWSNTFLMDQMDNKNKFELITKLDYQLLPFENELIEEIKILNEMDKAMIRFDLDLSQFSKYNFNQKIDFDMFKKAIDSKINIIKKANQELNLIIKNRNKNLDKIKTMSQAFQQSYKETINKIKKDNFESDGLKGYEIQATNHFKNMANNIYNLKKDFENVLNNEIILEIENDEKQNRSLTYFIPPSIKLNTDVMVSLLKIVFHAPDSSREDVIKWLKSLSKKGIKDFEQQKIIKALEKEIKKYVKVMVDGNKDYETLSLGQRSIYGLKYKFNQSLKKDLFLDQPEDNLDNNTIASEILSLISTKDKQQVFIVTHNANIGILSNPERIIIANLLNKEKPYDSIEIKSIMNENSANYLEGGKRFLEERFKKIIEGE